MVVFSSILGERGNNPKEYAHGGEAPLIRQYIYNHYFGNASSDIWKKSVYNMGTSGKPGLVNNNEKIQRAATINITQFPHEAVNMYKAFLREKLPNNVQEKYITDFLINIERNDGINSLYQSSLSLIDDLMLMDNQHLRLRENVDFIPFIESLVNRIKIFAKKLSPEAKDDRVALRTLYTATVSKLVSLKTNENRATVLNIPVFIETVQDHIKKLRDFEKIQENLNLIEYQEQYQESLSAKINEALTIIQTEVSPEIDKIFSEIGRSIEDLLKEIQQLVGQEEKNQAQLKEMRKKLVVKMIAKVFFDVEKLLTTVLTFLGPIGVAAAAIVGPVVFGLEGVVDHVIEDVSFFSQNNEDTVANFVTSLKDSIAKVNNVLSEEAELFKIQLGDISELLMKSSYNNDEVMNYLNNLKSKVAMELGSDGISDPTMIIDERKKLVHLLDKHSNVEKPLLRSWKTVKSIAKAGGDMALETYMNVRTDYDSIQEIDKAIEESQEKIQELHELARHILDEMVPMVKQLYEFMKNLMKNLENKSPVQLDVTNWKIQTKLKDMKSALSEVFEGFNAKAKFQSSFDKLGEGINALINVYDRIESYKDKAELAFFIGKMFQVKLPDIQDKNLLMAIRNLSIVIQSNLILEQHQLVMHAFKQQQYPFAQFQLSVFNFPPNIEPHNIESLIEKIDEQLNQLKNAIVKGKVTLGKYDKEVFKKSKFNSDKNKLPFYTWKYSDIQDEIKKFLRGESITLRSDIRKGRQLNAVKFNEIQLEFKTSDANLQDDLNSYLEYYNVKMEMVGNGYYKCGARIHYVSVDENIALEFSMLKQANGQPDDINEVYSKIKDNAVFVSPYAMWKIQLTKPNEASPNFTSKFEQNVIDLNLIGVGQYFKDGSYAPEVCTDQLDKHYHSDGLTTTSSSIRKMKFIHSL